jgi:hypothetical protein
MGLFKSSDELLEKGQDLIKQREFEKAINVLQNSAEKARSNGENDIFITSNALASVMRTFGNGQNASNYYNASLALQQLGEGDLKIGIKTVKAKELALECFVACEEISARDIPKSGASLQTRAAKLQEVGVKYQTQIGNRPLFMLELFFNTNETGIRRSFGLFAESQENLAEATVWFDPKKAAELYQNAANYRRQSGDVQNEQMDLAKIRQYSKSVSCWFCHREITGDQIQFFNMGAEVRPIRNGLKSDSPLPSLHESEDIIYACRGCHTAISKKADEIALAYHNAAIAKMVAIQNNLQSQIDQLRRAVNSVR